MSSCGQLTHVGDDTPCVLSPADFGRLIVEETEKWGKLIRAANIKVPTSCIDDNTGAGCLSFSSEPHPVSLGWGNTLAELENRASGLAWGGRIGDNRSYRQSAPHQKS